MKRILVLILSLMLVGISAQAYADNQSFATALLQVTVSPSIAVSSLTPNLNIGSVQTGSGGFNFPLLWNVSANVQQVSLMLEASNLYKGGDASVDDITKTIAVDTGTPADVIPANGNAVMPANNQGHGNILSWIPGSGTPLPGNPVSLPTVKTETWAFEASVTGAFNQNVTTRIYYQGPSPQQVQGVYNGAVRFTAFIIPPPPPL